MKRAITPLTVLFAMSFFATGTARADGFDGVWSVTQVCDKADDGALGYTFNYIVRVQGGVLEGTYKVPNNNGSIRLHGPIDSDGTATLDANGETGPPKYAVGQSKQGSPIHYHVAAKFTATNGTGNRVELRKCDFKFAKNKNRQ